jgi:hypothetical protein
MKYYVVCNKDGKCHASLLPFWSKDFLWRQIVDNAKNEKQAINIAKALHKPIHKANTYTKNYKI